MNSISQSDENKKWIEPLGAECIIDDLNPKVDSKYNVAYSIADLALLGTAFSGLKDIIKDISSNAQSDGKLYKAIFPVSGNLAVAKDGSGFLGTILNEKGRIAGQARFVEASDSSNNNCIATVFMALALIVINHSLKRISDTNKNIIGLIETEKHTQLIACLNTINDILCEYRYNWENIAWLDSKRNLVQDIQFKAEEQIQWYKEIIKNGFNKSKNWIEREIKYYKLSVYVYSFSSFLSMMMNHNFDSGYLNIIKNNIRTRESDYKQIAFSAWNAIAEKSGKARLLNVGSFFLNVLTTQSNQYTNSDTTDSSPLDEYRSKKIEEIANNYADQDSNESEFFINKIDQIGKMYNETLTIGITGDKLYISSTRSL